MNKILKWPVGWPLDNLTKAHAKSGFGLIISHPDRKPHFYDTKDGKWKVVPWVNKPLPQQTREDKQHG